MIIKQKTKKSKLSRSTSICLLSFLLTSTLIACQQNRDSDSVSNTGTLTTNTLVTSNDKPDNTWLTAVLKGYLDSNNNSCGNGSTIIGDQILNSQAKVNALAGIKIVTGNINLSSNVNLDFTPLNSLEKVTGDIHLSLSPNQTTLSGFDCLQEFNTLYVSNNPKLSSISGFQKVKKLGNGISLFRNAALETIPNFDVLTTMGDRLNISINPKLTNITGFPLLENIGNFDSFSGLAFAITGNEGLTEISGFPILKSMTSPYVGNFDINGNPNLISITGFNQLPNQLNSLITIKINDNPSLDCTRPAPSFLPVNISTNNLVDCVTSQ